MPGMAWSPPPVLRADAGDREVDIDLAGLGELQRGLEVIALHELFLQADEHHVVAAGIERDGLPRLDLEAAGHGRIFITPPSIFISWTSKLLAMSVEPPTRRSGAVPVLVIFI